MNTKLIKKGIASIRQYGFKVTYYRTVNRKKRQEQAELFMRDMIFTDNERVQQRNYRFGNAAKISILVPLYNTKAEFLKELIESVMEQTYYNWELCLADASDSGYEYISKLVTDYMRVDDRIFYKKLEKNGGISENTNACARLATGDYIALLDHDDLLAPNALFEAALAIEKGADFIYTDEMTFEGEILNPISIHFKPDFAPDNLRSNNYICHLSVFSKELFEKAGKFSSDCDGSQDYDIILRLTEQAENIVHIPKVLYYWRSHNASVASDIEAKPYCITSAIEAVDRHLERIGIDGEAQRIPKAVSVYKIKYDVIGNPKVAVIIAANSTAAELDKCIASVIERAEYQNFEVIISENSKASNKFEAVHKKYKNNDNIKIVKYSEKYDYALACNCAAGQTDAEYLLFVDATCSVASYGFIKEMLMYAQRKDVGAVGGKIISHGKKILNAGYVLGLYGSAGNVFYGATDGDPGYMYKLYYAQNYSAVSSSLMMIKKEKFFSVSGFSNEYKNSYYDVDMCLNLLKNGYVNVFIPFASAVSGKNESLQSPINRKDKQMFADKWKEEIALGDRYYNPNLSLESEDFSID